MARQSKNRKPIPLKPSNNKAVVVYTEGSNERTYLKTVAQQGFFQAFADGTPLTATDIKRRIEEIKKDLDNEAITQIFWIVDGGDNHIKQSKLFSAFYNKWQAYHKGRATETEQAKETQNKGWQKLKILINQPTLEYWLLLHKIDPPKKSADEFYCFEDIDALCAHADFKCAFPNFNKDRSSELGELITTLAEDNLAVKRAIRRSEQLGKGEYPLNKPLEFNIARAEMGRCLKRYAEQQQQPSTQISH